MKGADTRDLVTRYKRNYGIPADAEVTESMVQHHWELERRLTQELLESTPANRWDVFARCYGTLYRELDWLNRLIETSASSRSDEWNRIWMNLIGKPPRKVFEIGSGRGELISYLADRGYDCTATEITRERGEKFVSGAKNVTWLLSDGVHLDSFDSPETYDVALSNSLIEHLHPDDVCDHLKGVQCILKKGGRYIFCTPHKASGPSDVSAVFGCNEPMGMHLREYTYRELIDLASRAGFQTMRAALIPPSKICRLCRREFQPVVSHAYLVFLCGLERALFLLPSQPLRRRVARLSQLLLFRPCILVVAHKGD